jgi:hypothetical protein
MSVTPSLAPSPGKKSMDHSTPVHEENYLL